jgi:hypothetical protein
MKAGFHWICQTARCCGERFVRKRMEGRPFSWTHAECPICHTRLQWKTPASNRALAREAYLARAKRNREAGRTAHGSPKVRFAPTVFESAYAALKAEIQEAAGGNLVLPIATGFREESGVMRGRVNGREFVSNLITRGTKEAA